MFSLTRLPLALPLRVLERHPGFVGACARHKSSAAIGATGTTSSGRPKPATKASKLPITDPTRQFVQSHSPHIRSDLAWSESVHLDAMADSDPVRGEEAEERPLADIMDTHAHLDKLFYRKRLPVSTVAWQAMLSAYKHNKLTHLSAPRVRHFINIASTPSNWLLGREISTYSPRISVVYGCHPLMAHQYNDEIEQQLIGLLEDQNCVGVGETGLYYGDDTTAGRATKFLQKTVFAAQARLAGLHHKTLVVHSRLADADVFDVLKSTNPPPPRVVMHNYTGPLEVAEKLMDTFGPNVFFGVTGMVTFGVQAADVIRGIVNYLPMEAMVLESVAPYLAPEPHRSRVNHSGLLPFTAERVSRIKGLDIEEVYDKVWENSLRAFPGSVREDQ